MMSDDKYMKLQSKLIGELLQALEILHPRQGTWATPDDKQAKLIVRAMENARYYREV